MKKTFFIFIILLIVASVAFGIYYFQGDKRHSEEENLAPGAEEQKEEEEEQKEIFLMKEDFSVLMPEGWKEITAFQGVSAMVVYADEEITDPGAQKINFRTYYSITYDVLQGRTVEGYAEYIKESLRQLLVDVEFVKEETIEINSQDVYTIEIEVNQQGVNFKVLTFLIKGKGDDIWIISFNTTESNWDQYQDLFQKIAASFEAR